MTLRSRLSSHELAEVLQDDGTLRTRAGNEELGRWRGLWFGSQQLIQLVSFQSLNLQAEHLQNVHVVRVKSVGIYEGTAYEVERARSRGVSRQIEIAQTGAAQERTHTAHVIVPGLSRNCIIFQDALKLAVGAKCGPGHPGTGEAQHNSKEAAQHGAHRQCQPAEFLKGGCRQAVAFRPSMLKPVKLGLKPWACFPIGFHLPLAFEPAKKAQTSA